MLVILIVNWIVSLFVFSIDGPKQNAGSLLTPVPSIVFYALSSGTLGFALHGSFNNHLHERIWLAVEEFPPIRKWFTELPWRAKRRVPLERASKTILETGVKSDVVFCLEPSYRENKQCSCDSSCSVKSIKQQGIPILESKRQEVATIQRLYWQIWFFSAFIHLFISPNHCYRCYQIIWEGLSSLHHLIIHTGKKITHLAARFFCYPHKKSNLEPCYLW